MKKNQQNGYQTNKIVSLRKHGKMDTLKFFIYVHPITAIFYSTFWCLSMLNALRLLNFLLRSEFRNLNIKSYTSCHFPVSPQKMSYRPISLLWKWELWLELSSSRNIALEFRTNWASTLHVVRFIVFCLDNSISNLYRSPNS